MYQERNNAKKSHTVIFVWVNAKLIKSRHKQKSQKKDIDKK